MIRAEKRLFHSTYHIFRDDEYFGTLKASIYKPKAYFIAKEGNYTFFRENTFSGSYFCKRESSFKALADKPNGIGYSYVVRYNSVSYFVKPGIEFHDKLELNYSVYQNEEKIGKIYQNPTKFCLNIDITDTIPAIIKVFIFWLSFRAWAGMRSWNRLPLVGRFRI